MPNTLGVEMSREPVVGFVVGVLGLGLVSCMKVQQLAAKTPLAGMIGAKNETLALEDTPYCPGFLPEQDTASRENSPLVPSGVPVGEFCRTAALTPGSIVLIKDGPGQRKEYCPCPSNRCDTYGHPALLGLFDESKKRIQGASNVAMNGGEECGWPLNKKKTRENFGTIPGYVADGGGKEGQACSLLAFVPICGNAGSCCDGGRLTGRPLSAQRIADGKDPQINFKVCNELANKPELKASLCSLPLQVAAAAGMWQSSGKAMGAQHSVEPPQEHGKGRQTGHDACWASDQNNADGIVQAHCHDGGELVREEAGSTTIGGQKECHIVRKGSTPGQLDVFTFVVDCSADGGAAVVHHSVEKNPRDGLSAKLLTKEELEGHQTGARQSGHTKHNKIKPQGNIVVPSNSRNDSEW